MSARLRPAAARASAERSSAAEEAMAAIAVKSVNRGRAFMESIIPCLWRGTLSRATHFLPEEPAKVSTRGPMRFPSLPNLSEGKAGGYPGQTHRGYVRRRRLMLLAYFHQHFAGILAVQHADEGARGVPDASVKLLAILELALA